MHLSFFAELRASLHDLYDYKCACERLGGQYLVQWLQGIDRSGMLPAVEAAATQGHLNVVQWLHEHGAANREVVNSAYKSVSRLAKQTSWFISR